MIGAASAVGLQQSVRTPHASSPSCHPPSSQDKLDQVHAEDCRTEVLRQVKAQVWGGVAS